MKPTEKYSNWEELCQYYTNRLQKKIGPEFPAKAFHKWMLEREKVGKHFDEGMLYKCFNACKSLENDDDILWVFEGAEGTGKTTMAMQVACTIIPAKPILIYKADQLVSVLKKAKEMFDEGQKYPYPIVIDEGALLLFGKDTQAKDNKNIIKAMSVMRFLNLAMFICIPTFYDIDAYIRKNRCGLCISIMERGRYKGITKPAIQYAANFERNVKQIGQVKLRLGTFWEGYFNKEWPEQFITPMEAKVLKGDNFGNFLEGSTGMDVKQKWVKAGIAGKYIGVSTDAIRKRILKGTIPGRKSFGMYFVEKEWLDQQ
jgi:hypothetical protein